MNNTNHLYSLKKFEIISLKQLHICLTGLWDAFKKVFSETIWDWFCFIWNWSSFIIITHLLSRGKEKNYDNSCLWKSFTCCDKPIWLHGCKNSDILTSIPLRILPPKIWFLYNLIQLPCSRAVDVQILALQLFLMAWAFFLTWLSSNLIWHC